MVRLVRDVQRDCQRPSDQFRSVPSDISDQMCDVSLQEEPAASRRCCGPGFVSLGQVFVGI